IGRRLAQQPALQLRPPVTGGLVEEAGPVAHGPALGVVGAPHHPPYARVTDGPGAHGARLERHIQGQAGQPVVAGLFRRLAQGQDLGVGGRIVSPDGGVSGGAEHLAGAFVDHQGADGRLAVVRRRLRQIKRRAHEAQIMVRHSDDTAKKPRSRQAEKAPPRKGGGKPGGPRAAKAPETPVRKERIAKTLARAGVASRREVERLIGLGKIAVNGRILDTPAVLVGRDDVITVEGKVVGGPEATRVWRYHKPVGLLTTHKDPAGRPTVFDALPPGLPRVISVGRLDINSEGLLLLTNDGELARALEMPSTAWVRQYRARARGRVTQADLDRLKDGITVDGVQYGPIEATLDKAK